MEPLNAPNSPPEEVLPVNVRELTDKRHAIVRLNQVQRAILKDPGMFTKVDSDRSLNHLRTETQKLQQALLARIQKQVTQTYEKLKGVFALMQSWAAEEELSDVFLLDHQRHDDIQADMDLCEDYTDWLDILPRLEEERERLFQKYSGFFKTRIDEIISKREATQKKLSPCKPKMEEARQRLESFQSNQQQINYYANRSTNALVGGMAAFVGLTLFGFFSGIWGGWLWGLFLGYLVFSNIATLYTDVEGEPMKELYAFLQKHYEIKNIKPFFQYDNKEKPEEPTRFDASRGEVLARFMQKDVKSAVQEFTQWERQHTEHVGYLQYLEGQRAWSQDQLRRLTEWCDPDALEEVMATVEEPVSDVKEMVAPPEPTKPVVESFEKIPELPRPPADPEKPVAAPQRKTSQRAKKVRPAKMPDRAS